MKVKLPDWLTAGKVAAFVAADAAFILAQPDVVLGSNAGLIKLIAGMLVAGLAAIAPGELVGQLRRNAAELVGEPVVDEPVTPAIPASTPIAPESIGPLAGGVSGRSSQLREG